VRLFDLSGREVRTLLDHVRQAAGRHLISVQGRALRPGIYLYQVNAGEESARGKLVLIR
jgi:hypothetical protein